MTFLTVSAAIGGTESSSSYTGNGISTYSPPLVAFSRAHATSSSIILSSREES